MSTYTSSLGLVKPTVGGVQDHWGDNGWASPADTPVGLNDNFEMLDYHVLSKVDGGNVSGNIIFDNAIWLRGKDTGGTQRNLVQVSAADRAVFGGTTLDTDITTASSGTIRFYCGTTNVDAAITTNQFFMRGSSGMATTGPLRIEATIDDNLNITAEGVTLGHGGSNAYLDNALDVGNIQFRFGGTTEAYIEPDGTIHGDGDADFGGAAIFGGGGTFGGSVGVTGSGTFSSYLETGAAGTLALPALRFTAHRAGDGIDTTSAGAMRFAVNAAQMLSLEAQEANFGNSGTNYNLVFPSGTEVNFGSGGNVNFLHASDGGSTSASILAAGTSLSTDTAIVTREKGDARYVQIATNLQPLGTARVTVSGTTPTLTRSGGIVTGVTRTGTGTYRIDHSTRANSIFFVTPINSSNRTTAIVTATTNTSVTLKFETGGGSAVDCSFNFLVF